MDSRPTGPRSARAVRRYVAVVAALALLAVPAFLALVALGAGLTLNMAYDKVAIRLADKMALAEGRDGRRILAFGGSNTFFDFRGVDIEAATGLPAINLGTHSGNGLKFLLWQAETVARPGDIILLPVEDGYYTEPGITYYGANVSLAMGANFFWTLPLRDQVNYLRNIHVGRLFKVAAARLGLADYELEPDWTFPINDNGDMEAPAPSAEQVSALIGDVSGQRSKVFAPTSEAEATIREFVARMRARDVAVLFSLPGIMENAAPDEAQTAALAAALDTVGAAFLDLPENGSIPAEMMFDTIYHAAREGAELYTAQIITALCALPADYAIDCKAQSVRQAEALRKTAADRSFLFGAGPALQSLQPFGDGSPVLLEPGQPQTVRVAVLRGCRNDLEIAARGDGTLSVDIAGKAQQPLGGEGGETVQRYRLPNRPGLVPISIEAATSGELALTGLKRVSACRS